MELNITDFFNTARPAYYSASAAELGDDAGAITWANAIDAAETWAAWLDTDDKRDEFRAYVRTFGAWDDEEIAAWTDEELTALLIQFISGDIRESGLHDGASWAEYEEAAQAGRISGNIFRADNGGIFYVF
jgi:hypothetical protein